MQASGDAGFLLNIWQTSTGWLRRQTRSALFWDFTQRRTAVSLPTFRGQSFKGEAWPLKMGTTGSPETSVLDYNYALWKKNPQKRRPHLRPCGILKSRILSHSKACSLCSEGVRLESLSCDRPIWLLYCLSLAFLFTICV